MRRLNAAAAGLLLASLVHADVADELGDVAARVDYGYYAEDAAVVAAARERLEQISGSDPLVEYYRGYASMRLAQLPRVRAPERDAALAACVTHAETAAASEALAAEAWVLAAACSGLAARREPLRGVLHERRMQQALRRARADSPGNPRLALVGGGGFAFDGDAPEAPASSLAETLAAFRDWPRPFELPDWGEAEVLVALGARHLARGDARAARDFVEQALLIAPDYRAARALETRIRTGGRTGR